MYSVKLHLVIVTYSYLYSIVCLQIVLVFRPDVLVVSRILFAALSRNICLATHFFNTKVFKDVLCMHACNLSEKTGFKMVAVDISVAHSYTRRW